MSFFELSIIFNLQVEGRNTVAESQTGFLPNREKTKPFDYRRETGHDALVLRDR